MISEDFFLHNTIVYEVIFILNKRLWKNTILKKMKPHTTQPKKGEKKAATPPLRRYKTKLPMYYFKFRQHLPSFVPTQHCVNLHLLPFSSSPKKPSVTFPIANYFQFLSP